MLFNSLNYLVFFPIVLLLYFVLPKKVRYLWLLGASYYFYACWNAKYALLLLFSTGVTYLSGLLIASARKRGKKTEMKLWVAGSFVINLGILAVFKYSGFVAENVNALMKALGSSARMGAPDVRLRKRRTSSCMRCMYRSSPSWWRAPSSARPTCCRRLNSRTPSTCSARAAACCCWGGACSFRWS